MWLLKKALFFLNIDVKTMEILTIISKVEQFIQNFSCLVALVKK